jgi:hypothetical protein
MNTETTQTTRTDQDRLDIIDALLAHVNKRIGMDFRDYGTEVEGRKAFRSEYNEVLKDGRDARALINFIASRPLMFNADLLFKNCDKGDRLTYSETLKEWDYCVGQYWPTEYRAAACRWCSNVIVQAFRVEYKDYQDIKKQLRAYLGRGIVNRWF